MSKATDGFVEDAPQFDDITIPGLKYDGARSALTVEATDENVGKVMGFIEGFLDGTDAGMKTRMQLVTAAEEIFVNIAHYAYGEGTGSADIDISKVGENVELTFIDGGMQYDPLQKDDPDVTLAAEERKIGGLGIFMAKKLSDDMRYEYKDGKNVLTLVKKI